MAFTGRSIRHRLLLLIIATVLAVVVVHDVAAFIALRRTALSLATERLHAVSTRLGQMFQVQGRDVRQQLRATGQGNVVRSFFNGTTSADTVIAVLRRVANPTVTATELWGPDGQRLLATAPAPTQDTAHARQLLQAVAGPDSAAIGRMHVVRDTLVHGVIARVTDGRRALGYIVEWRRVATSAEGRQQLLGLIGSDASIYAGNANAEGWTDFATVVERPAVPLTTDSVSAFAQPGEGRKIAAARAIAGTPWAIVVAFPEDRVYAPAYAMLRRLAAITVILLGVAILAAWVFGTRLTTPLSELAGAAAALSAGDYSRRVSTAGPEEVGTLARAFNSMADSVAGAHRELQERADELADRAGQLAEQATELEMANEELAHSVDEVTRTRDELAAVTAELDACLASAPVGFAFHDATGRYRRVNTSLARLNGAPADAHLGKRPSDIVPVIGAQLEREIAKVLAGGNGTFNIEVTGETSGSRGTTQHWLVSVFPIRTRDDVELGVASVVTDLTAYKQLERQLLHAQKMEAVGRLAGGVAHDFNNILTAITGFGEFALADLDSRDRGDPRGDLEQVLAAAERGGSLTRQLLAFSRQQVLQPRVLNLNAVVASLSPMLARLIGTDIRLQTSTAPSLGAVKADPSQMEQVLVNLVVNARDAMPNGGTVTIETADVELDASYASSHEGVAPGSYVMLAVTDSGIGMDAPTRARAFDPFFTTKPPGKGTGLGLSTVYGIVKQSGGSVEVYSEPGRGTSVKVYLPRTDERADRHTPTRGVAGTPSVQATILLVDDDPHVATASRRALERAGYVVLPASNGREALEVAERYRGRIDLLVTDLVMPEMGGRELARRLVGVRPDVHVLFTSGYTAEAMNQQAILEPGDAFLGKPYSPDGLVKRAHEILKPSA
ncbi:MAG TPA: ATP-binding protein [Gemmatimonadaceae bacterium]|jgi:PAS domain S-box-containing protein|nr:ATP-binding protein [Gemmatimonadaceae bacterium]